MPDMKKLADSLPDGMDPEAVIQMVKDAGYTVEEDPDYVAVTISSADYEPGEEEKDKDDKGVQEEDEKKDEDEDDGPEVGSDGFNNGSHGDRLKAIRKMMKGS